MDLIKYFGCEVEEPPMCSPNLNKTNQSNNTMTTLFPCMHACKRSMETRCEGYPNKQFRRFQNIPDVAKKRSFFENPSDECSTTMSWQPNDDCFAKGVLSRIPGTRHKRDLTGGRTLMSSSLQKEGLLPLLFLEVILLISLKIPLSQYSIVSFFENHIIHSPSSWHGGPPGSCFLK